MTSSTSRPLTVVLGNQLFPLEHFDDLRDGPVFMAEDLGLCTYVRHHQQKIVLFLAAMRSFRDRMEEDGFDLRYHELDADDESFTERLDRVVDAEKIDEIRVFEIEDKPMEETLRQFAEDRDLTLNVLESPMFLCSRQRFDDYLSDAKRPFMAEFYKGERRRLGLMVDDDGEPDGGRWSFDEDNRKKLPKKVEPPEVEPVEKTGHVNDVIELVRDRFDDHPGDARQFWWPTTRETALEWLDSFLAQRFEQFGPYEDAMSTRSKTVFHSLLSPLLNMGLLTPDEVVKKAIDYAEDNDVPINSVEGFVRQIIGWREFIRGIYQNFDDE